MKVRITETAWADLAKIGRDIKSKNPSRAASFVDELEDRCRRLGVMPFAFALMPGWKEQGIRRRPHGNYLIFYRIRGEDVEVLHVLHGARDYEAALFSDR